MNHLREDPSDSSTPGTIPSADDSSQISPVGNRSFTDALTGTHQTRINASIENWQRKLLDLTKRNRALNFRVNKVSSVTIVDEHPAEIFRRLYIKEQLMKFKAAAESDSENNAAPLEPDSSSSQLSGISLTVNGLSDEPESDEELPLAVDFVPYDPQALDERHTDEWLQTTSSPDALDKSLRRLDEQARLSIEEQGVNTLFLALGMLHYTESADSTENFRAPILLLPVELSRKSARAGYSIKISDDEPMLNPALAEYLRQSYGIALPELPDSAAMADDFDIQPFPFSDNGKNS